MKKTPNNLFQLECLAQEQLDVLNYPARDWVKARRMREAGAFAYDVVIVGGGQSGVAAAFALQREKVSNILVLDKKPLGEEGPWLDFARMPTLRTPKSVLGPDFGVPALTLQAWYKAKFGQQAWEEMVHLPRELWMDYLNWFKGFLKLPIINDAAVGELSWDEEERVFSIPYNQEGVAHSVCARKVILATGIEGSGSWVVPDFIKNHLAKKFYHHTSEDIDFHALRGKKVGVLGAGASAFDNSILALQRECKEVRLFFRRSKMSSVNPYRWAEFVGFLRHHKDLGDLERWRFIHKILTIGQLPPKDTYAAATSFENFHLEPASPWLSVKQIGEQVEVTTPHGPQVFDHLIIGTGFKTDLSLRTELGAFCDDIAVWGDKFIPPEGQGHSDLLRHPYLGEGFKFTEKTKGAAPYLNSLFNYTFGALLSHGFSGASISGMKYSIQSLVSEITRQFYMEDQESYFDDLCAYDVHEF